MVEHRLQTTQETIDATAVISEPLLTRCDARVRVCNEAVDLNERGPLMPAEDVTEALGFELGDLQAAICLPSSGAPARPLLEHGKHDLFRMYIFDLGASEGRHVLSEAAGAPSGRHHRQEVDAGRYLVVGAGALRRARQGVAGGMTPEQALDRTDVVHLSAGQSMAIGTESWVPATGADVSLLSHDDTLRACYNCVSRRQGDIQVGPDGSLSYADHSYNGTTLELGAVRQSTKPVARTAGELALAG